MKQDGKRIKWEQNKVRNAVPKSRIDQSSDTFCQHCQYLLYYQDTLGNAYNTIADISHCMETFAISFRSKKQTQIGKHTLSLCVVWGLWGKDGPSQPHLG